MKTAKKNTMPKQQKKVLEEEEIEESESDHIGSATDEENESEAGESEAEDSAECESEVKDEEVAALDASSTDSDEEEDDEVTANADDDDDEEESEEDEEEAVKGVEVSDDDDDDEEEDDEVEVDAEDDEDDDEEEDDEKDEEDDEEDDDEEEENDDIDMKALVKKAINAKKQKDDDDDEDSDEVDDDKDVPKPRKPVVVGNLVDKVKTELTKRYEHRQGLQLFIRLGEKLPEDFEELETKVKSLSPLIVKVHKPRQKYARFCLVEFANKEDRDKAFSLLTESSKGTKLVVSLPRIEQEGFVEKLAEKRAQKIEQTRAKKLLKKESKIAAIQEKFTSNILVYNIPKSASVAQIKELFPEAVDIQLKPAPKKFVGVCTAAVTCPSTKDAKMNQKRQLTLGGNKLIIRFNNVINKKPGTKPPGKKAAQGETPKGPLAPKNKKEPQPKKTKPAEEKDEQPKPVLGKKRLSDGVEEDAVVPEKKTKVESAKPPQKKQKLPQNGEQKTGPKPPQKKQTQALNGNAKEKAPVEQKAVAAKPPQKKQPLNGNAKQSQQETTKANGQPPQKKGGAPFKPKLAGKKPFVKKQQTQKPAAKKGGAKKNVA